MSEANKDALIDAVIDAMADLIEAEAALKSATARLARLSSALEKRD